MKALSLFSGIGGIDLACEWAGIETVAFCERDKFCQKVLAKHWPDVPIFDDVTTLRGDQIGAVDLIYGGYPCQGESLAGRRKGAGDDRWLWPAMFVLVEECRPAWVLGENVAGHVTMGLDAALSDLEGAGYSARPFVIPACAVDAPHRRERVFIVAYDDHAGRQRQDVPIQRGRPSKADIKSSGVCPVDTDPAQLGRHETQTPDSPIAGGQLSWSARGFGGDTQRFTWLPEPNLCRVVDGLSDWMVCALGALGNAVVPQQVYPILAAMKKTHDLFQEAPNEQ